VININAKKWTKMSFLKAIDVGAEDVNVEGDLCDVYTAPPKLEEVVRAGKR